MLLLLISGYFELDYSRMPINHENGLDVRRFVDVLRDGIMIHAKELAGAKALINGKVVIPLSVLLYWFEHSALVKKIYEHETRGRCGEKLSNP